MRLCKRKCLTRHLTRGQRSVHFLKFKVLNLVSSPLPPPGLAYPQSHGQDEEEVQGQHRDVTCLQAPLGKGLQGVRRCGPRAAGAALHGAEHTLHPVEVTCASDAEPSTTLPCSLPAWDRQVGDTRSLPAWDSQARRCTWRDECGDKAEGRFIHPAHIHSANVYREVLSNP